MVLPRTNNCIRGDNKKVAEAIIYGKRKTGRLRKNMKDTIIEIEQRRKNYKN